MADTSMDFQTETSSVPSLSGELLEPPAVDLEEDALVERAGPQDSPRLLQPSFPFRALSSDRNSPAAETPRCLGAGQSPGAPGRLSAPGHVEGPLWVLDLDLQAAGEAGNKAYRDPARAMEGNEETAVPKSRAHELEAGSRVPAGMEQAELRMELDEEPRLGGQGWTEGTEAGQAQMQGLLDQLKSLSPSFRDDSPTPEDRLLPASDGEEGSMDPIGRDVRLPGEQAAWGECQGHQNECGPCPLHIATGHGLRVPPCWSLHTACSRRARESHGLLFAEADCEDLLSLLRYEGGLPTEPSHGTSLAHLDVLTGTSCQMLRSPDAVSPTAGEAVECPGGGRTLGADVWPDPSQETPPGLELGSVDAGGSCPWLPREGVDEEGSTSPGLGSHDSSPEPEWTAIAPTSNQRQEQPPQGGATTKAALSSFPACKEVPGPCEPEDLLDGVIFGAKYLGSTQLVSERNPPTSVRMAQAQEAMDRIKAPEGESQPMTEVDLFVSTQRIKVLTADSQEAMMDHPLQTISYIADIGNIVVLMARRKLPRQADASGQKRLYKMICHVFHSADAQLIAQAIGQAFSVAYQHFLQASGIDPSQLSAQQYGESLDSEELYNGDLAHFSKQENCKDVCICKQKGEILGIVVVESGWGSILPTVVIANLMHGGPAEKSGELSIGDRIMSINGMSLVGLPLGTCQNIIRDLKYQTEATLNIVHCPPVTTAIIRRPDTKYQLGFCVEDGIICSLMRGCIAERGGIRVGHRIIEINGQSVVATPHEKIIQILTEAVSEVHIKTMPASTYRLLTGQEKPVFL
uniref:Amyloid-beta A4 precursor protein-binding family A member 3 n=1 Tax=Sphenodon punctatus TaxID=8508 RepID=A0A8D0HJ89_SPHPU